ncbi:MAG: hypothetical protein DI582_08230 [Azospirillum brasilense]|nr:MAG: hypothetical protein DI582_08230 [Azospirillum brasilense]
MTSSMGPAATVELKGDVYFVYDGECPICTLGARFYQVRRSVGKVITVDARTEADHFVMQEVKVARLDLDEGMVIRYQDRLYQGAEALHLMATLGADEGLLNQLNNKIFVSRRLADLLYPSMRMARNIALRLKGSGKIRNLST